ncbi:hypothetical protein L0657_09705 [Dyadobacter sp. CY345]|uniref:hypothetical protein n=1 Tax=Dyadobacter sp. CY345 TaxID=2909335 RepID=UPI001F4475CB|nr:hypothetical protein [Dyadobacter sp. CY345]MCF2444232.1 hypothetical protein [Dyadobacter sp. CY345]
MLKFIFRFIIFLIIVAGIAELVLRYKYGFCNAPLYVSDPDFEYIYAPNQEVKRFGNVVRTNNFSMRNDPLSPADSIVILLIGDSVVNGGSLTDQDSLASGFLEKRLSSTLNTRVRVLNISAGSWGPDNVAAYLKKFGLFKAKLICLVTSSHDAHDIMGHESIIGIDPNMPDKQYPSAILEVWERYKYLYPYYIEYYSAKIPFFSTQKEIDPVAQKPKTDSLAIKIEARRDEKIISEKPDDGGIRKSGIGFNPGYAELVKMAKDNNIPFFIYLHPEISEVEAGKFNDQGDEIISFAKENHVRLVNEFDYGITTKLYRKMDVVHFNNPGQVFLANNLYPLFLDYLNKKQ